MINIAPSIFAAKDILRGIREAEEGGCKMIHWDILNGTFVKNCNNLNEEVIAIYRKETDLFFDVHLMIEEPSSVIKKYKQAGANSITIHAEINDDLKNLLVQIQDMGIERGVAINPETPINKIENLLPYVNTVLLMSVNPGYCGQKFIPSIFDKLYLLKELLKKFNLNNKIKISIDGGINLEVATKLAKMGADILVVGSFIYAQEQPVKIIKLLNNIN